jgi:hypothetical protein
MWKYLHILNKLGRQAVGLNEWAFSVVYLGRADNESGPVSSTRFGPISRLKARQSGRRPLMQPCYAARLLTA